jgi:hypothetical protein
MALREARFPSLKRCNQSGTNTSQTREVSG